MSSFDRSVRRVLGALVIGLAGVSPFVTGSCQADTGETLGGTFCTFQQTLSCTTDAGCRGTSTCLPDLSGYGPCICSDGGVGDGSAGAEP